MERRYTEEQVLKLLRERIKEAGSGVRFGKTHGFTSSFLTQVFKKQCPLSDRLLEAIGLEKVVEYQKKRRVVGENGGRK